MKRWLYRILLISMLFWAVGCYSCGTWNEMWGKGPVDPAVEHKTFLDSDCKPMVAKAPAPKPVPKPQPVAKPKPKPAPTPSGCGPSGVTRVHPCEDCGVVKIEKQMPQQVTLNAPFSYHVTVTNLTGVLVNNVVVKEKLDTNFKFASSSPSAQVSGESLVWKVGVLEPKASKKLKVTGSATAPECIQTCATVSYTVPACANVEVVQPALRLTKTAPKEVLLCDPIPVKMTVTNTGTGLARNVKVTDTLPAGLTTTDGRKSVTLNAGTLAAGQSKSFSMNLKASKTGTYVNKATAASTDGLKAQASTTTVVKQPVLAISKTGPQKRYLGRSVTYDVTVANKGNAAAANTVVVDTLPSGAKFVSATAGGKLSGNTVTWQLGTLKVGASKKVSVTVMPNSAGTIKNVAKATATCASGVSSSTSTVIAGIPAVLLEVIDIDDPVELGSGTTYVITATNQGSAVGTNIKIDCELEDNMSYVSSSGATRGQAVGNKVSFAPLGRLAPKAKATWRVKVKALKAGDVRFKVTMNTDQITRPVQETEATHLYE